MQQRNKKLLIGIPLGVLILLLISYITITKGNINPKRQVGEVVDSFNGVEVYYNGGVNHVAGRNTTTDGYNLGLKYQCVEFIKRYYYQRLQHKMPDPYGHAKSFFNPTIESGKLNPQRGLLQFANGTVKPQLEDIIVFAATLTNRYGHVAIISKITDTSIEVVQQNPGPFGNSRETIALKENNGLWLIDKSSALGLLRKP